MEQVTALNALEPFLALTKSASSPRAAADLITRATSASNTFLFTELLESAPIQSLSKSSEYYPYFRLLEIFSYGTYSTYVSQSSALPPLTHAQALKLRQLSLLSLPHNNHDYPTLQRLLGLESSRELESVIISALYAGLIQAQLDPAKSTLHLFRVAPLRDLPPAAISSGGLLNRLRTWTSRCDNTLASLEAEIDRVRAEADRRASENLDWNTMMKEMLEEEKSKFNEQEIRGKDGHTLGAGLGAGLALPVRAAGLGGAGEGTSGNQNAVKAPSRFSKRSSEHMEGSGGGEGDDEAMDVDDDEDTAKRASRRKLDG